MGIIGIGSDTTNIQRIEKAYAKFGERFLNRIFSAEEIKKANSRKLVSERLFASTLAKRFAAKEAFAKAIGTGFSNGVFHKNISVTNAASGKPQLVLSGGALKVLQSLSSKDIPILNEELVYDRSVSRRLATKGSAACAALERKSINIKQNIKIDLSMSDDYPVASAIVIISSTQGAS